MANLALERSEAKDLPTTSESLSKNSSEEVPMHEKRNIHLPGSVYTPAELAELWHVTPAVILREISLGKLKAFSVGSSKRILGDEIQRYEVHSEK